MAEATQWRSGLTRVFKGVLGINLAVMGAAAALRTWLRLGAAPEPVGLKLMPLSTSARVVYVDLDLGAAYYACVELMFLVVPLTFVLILLTILLKLPLDGE